MVCARCCVVRCPMMRTPRHISSGAYTMNQLHYAGPFILVVHPCGESRQSCLWVAHISDELLAHLPSLRSALRAACGWLSPCAPVHQGTPVPAFHYAGGCKLEHQRVDKGCAALRGGGGQAPRFHLLAALSALTMLCRCSRFSGLKRMRYFLAMAPL